MLKWFKERHQFAKVAGLWADVTRFDPGDRGQVAVMASNMRKQVVVSPEDAWLTGLVNWMYNIPNEEYQRALAHNILEFLDFAEHKLIFSKEAYNTAREFAVAGLGQRHEHPSLEEAAGTKSRGFISAFQHLSENFHIQLDDVPSLHTVESSFEAMSPGLSDIAKTALVYKLVTFNFLGAMKLMADSGEAGSSATYRFIPPLYEKAKELALSAPDASVLASLTTTLDDNIQRFLNYYGLTPPTPHAVQENDNPDLAAALVLLQEIHWPGVNAILQQRADYQLRNYFAETSDYQSYLKDILRDVGLPYNDDDLLKRLNATLLVCSLLYMREQLACLPGYDEKKFVEAVHITLKRALRVFGGSEAYKERIGCIIACQKDLQTIARKQPTAIELEELVLRRASLSSLVVLLMKTRQMEFTNQYKRYAAGYRKGTLSKVACSVMAESGSKAHERLFKNKSRIDLALKRVYQVDENNIKNSATMAAFLKINDFQ